jgi:hypothetical protein
MMNSGIRTVIPAGLLFIIPITFFTGSQVSNTQECQALGYPDDP